jgi:hypothetical protein
MVMGYSLSSKTDAPGFNQSGNAFRTSALGIRDKVNFLEWRL